jgi:hypothetical protein
MVEPGDVGTFTVGFLSDGELRVRVFRTSDSFVLFEATWSWFDDPPTNIPITIAP